MLSGVFIAIKPSGRIQPRHWGRLNSDIPWEALICFSGYFAVCQTAISGFADEILKLQNVFAFTIAADASNDLWKNLQAVNDRGARQFNGPRAVQKKAYNIFRRARAIGADDGNVF